MLSSIKLFNSVIIKEHQKELNPSDLKFANIFKETYKYGFIISPEVVSEYSFNDLKQITAEMISVGIFKSSEQMNKTFQTWTKMRDSDIETLVIEQLIHYMTTYGFEELGIYSEDTVYFPTKDLDIPDIDVEKFNFTVIKGITEIELAKRTLKFVNSGIALKEETIKDVFDVISTLHTNSIISNEEIETVKNKELKIKVYEHLNIVPKNASEFLRVIINKATGNALLIKSKSVIEQLKKLGNDDVFKYFSLYKLLYKDFNALSKSFFRFKPLFLALKRTIFDYKTKEINKIINKIRKDANFLHTPMSVDFLNSITEKLKSGEEINEQELMKTLDRVNVFRKVKLLNALDFRTQDVKSILYRIRNSKAFVTDFESNYLENKSVQLEYNKIKNIILSSIAKTVEKNLSGKKVYIPDNIFYAIPNSEKQFAGNFPNGTYVKIEKDDLLFGVHWFDLSSPNHYDNRIDLDLSMLTIAGEKLGWDGGYRTNDRTILFSGDNTSAPRPTGASEMFYINNVNNEDFLVYLNFYNSWHSSIVDKIVNVPYTLFIGKEKVNKAFDRQYMINPNNIICQLPCQISSGQKQTIIGFISINKNESRFYITNYSLGNNKTVRNNKYSKKANEFLSAYYKSNTYLDDVLAIAKINIVNDAKDADIDLSVNNISKDTFLSIFM